jgi:hypothetical protein
VYEIAGVAGVPPEGYSLRELCWLARGVDKAAWARTAMLCAVVASTFGGRKRRFKPSDFSPYEVYTGKERVSFKDLLRMMARATRRGKHA